MSAFELLSFGEGGWGFFLIEALGVTLALAVAGMLLGIMLGLCGSLAALSSVPFLRGVAVFYSTVLRGIPDLLVIYLFYFGSSSALTAVSRFFGGEGFVGVPAFIIGVCALGIVSGAYLTEVFRGAIQSIDKGEIEAAFAFGMGLTLRIKRIVIPLAARHALPGIGNVWQMILKETALISVIGVVELMRQAQIGGGSTHQYFTFYMAAAVLYFGVSWLSGRGFDKAETRTMRSIQRNTKQKS
ncbi:ABC transporter permease subunit [Affinibrenneria salicis]|uniref:ABC transporter permease subunit n=1 Tax=Affinibrenneria salicis TaxID=2590031 RepID=A0A5J5G3I8_9GAMM|nr:ABC transporter permease subunit [Affinibrenneria salicis]KAA9001310.1 ABC transporter permease subunit [Affinibrenneria salicis]